MASVAGPFDIWRGKLACPPQQSVALQWREFDKVDPIMSLSKVLKHTETLLELDGSTDVAALTFSLSFLADASRGGWLIEFVWICSARRRM